MKIISSKSILGILFSVILFSGSIPLSLSELDEIPTLKQQLKSGVSLEDIICKENYSLLLRSNGSPVCVKDTSFEKLVERGWGLTELLESFIEKLEKIKEDVEEESKYEFKEGDELNIVIEILDGTVEAFVQIGDNEFEFESEDIESVFEKIQIETGLGFDTIENHLEIINQEEEYVESEREYVNEEFEEESELFEEEGEMFERDEDLEEEGESELIEGEDKDVTSLPELVSGDQNCTINWSYPILGVTTEGGFAVGPDGTIYAGTSEGLIYAVNSDGSKKWTSSFEAPADQAKYVDISTIPDEIKDAIPPGFDISTIPDSIFTTIGFDLDDFSHSSPTLTPDGKILYTGGHVSGIVYAINTDDGSIIWPFNVQDIPEVKNDPIHYGGGFISSPTIGADGTIYIGSGDWWGDQWGEATGMGIDVSKIKKREFSDKRLYAINPDGTLKWIFEVDESFKTSIFGSPVVDSNGTIFFGSYNGIFYAIRDDGNKATKIWTFDANKSEFPNTSNRDKEFWPSPAIGADGTIYSGNNDFYIYAFNPDNGNVKWAFETLNEVYQSATIGADGTIFIGSEDGNLYALNKDGTVKWEYSTGFVDSGAPFTATVLNDNSIVFGMSTYNRIVSLDGNDKSLKWQCDFGSSAEGGTSMNPSVGADGSIYVYVDGNIHSIKGSSPLSSESPWPKVNRDSHNSGRIN